MVELDPDQVPHTYRIVSPLWSIPGARSLSHRIASEARTGARLGKASLRTAADLLRDPLGTIEQLGRTTGSIARVVKPATTPLSALMTQRSLNTCFDAVSVPFADFKAAARSVDATLNDAFVATTLDALRRYHDAMGSPCSAGQDEHAGQCARRRVGEPVRQPVRPHPHGAATQRCRSPPRGSVEIKALLRAVTAEPALPHVNDISGVISRLGPAASVSVLGAMLKGVDITTSNVPGPSFPVFMAGAKVEEFQAFGPLAGAAINITLFSYDGIVHLGINSDRAAVVDHDLFTRCLREAIDATLTLTAPA